jgi:hypothetical protein
MFLRFDLSSLKTASALAYFSRPSNTLFYKHI